ncbi:MAG: adenylate kinase [Actinomycetota bacterium]|nr:adenylate kinase [Actinomycetota bacterium]
MTPGVRLILLGKQGAGKGTQCVRLSRHYVVPHIATGDMFRAAVKSGTEAGRLVKRYLDAGELVPDVIVMRVVADRLDQDDTKARGFVLDGFPRTVHQAEALAALLSPSDVDVVIDLEVPTGLVLQRLASRRVCSACGANYSLDSPPKFDWTCDVCGGEVVQRGDDTEVAIRRRLKLYEVATAPLVQWYLGRGQLEVVDGVGDADTVMARLVAVVDARRGIRAESP